MKLSYAEEPSGRTMETNRKTTTGTEVEFTLTGLSAGTDYRLTAVLGDESLATGGFRTWSKAATARKHLKLSVVPGVQEDYPWLAEGLPADAAPQHASSSAPRHRRSYGEQRLRRGKSQCCAFNRRSAYMQNQPALRWATTI